MKYSDLKPGMFVRSARNEFSLIVSVERYGLRPGTGKNSIVVWVIDDFYGLTWISCSDDGMWNVENSCAWFAKRAV